MRVRSLVFAACALALLSGRVAADPIPPSESGLIGWADEEERRFALTWDGGTATFWVDKVGSSTYRTLDQCCTDVFTQIAGLYTGSLVQVSGLVLNATTPVGLTFVDGFNFDLLRDVAPSITSLTGYLTLDLPPQTSVAFNFSPLETALTNAPPPEQQVPSVPEPATLLLMGTGLIAIGKVVQRRAPRA